MHILTLINYYLPGYKSDNLLEMVEDVVQIMNPTQRRSAYVDLPIIIQSALGYKKRSVE